MFKKIISRIRHGYYSFFKILIFAVAILLIVMAMPRGVKFKYTFQAGKPWLHSKLIAPFDFPVLKPDEQIRLERRQIEENIPPYFVFDEGLNSRGLDKLIAEFNNAWKSKYADEGLKLRQESLGFLLNIYDSIQEMGILKYHPVLEGKGPDYQVNVVRNKLAVKQALGQLHTIRSAYDATMELIDKQTTLDVDLLKELSASMFIQNLVYDESLTKQEIAQATSRLSTTYGLIQKGELIINEGELIDETRFNVINSLRKEYESRVGSSKQQQLIMLGQFILVGIVLLILFLFIRYVRPDVFDQLKKINLILLLMLLLVVPAFTLVSLQPHWIWYLPYGILTIIMITFFDTRLTLMVHILTVILIAMVVPNAFEFIFLQLTIGYVVIFTLMRHNKRIFFFRTSVFLFLTYAVVYTSFSLMQQGDFSAVEPVMYLAFAASALLTLLALPLIFLLERMFGMLTDLSLLELSNTNSPLLRELAMVAPGTFQHSMQVANLSEEALYEINGDTLLARTGALYHDIGKMDNPMYFIENQMGSYNPHDDLSYTESASIIVGHVTKGIEKARKAGLPEQIIDFIRTHHGNRRVEYFYIMEQRQNPGLELDERDFSYRGPVPFSKETAVVMMADSVEAASRSMKNHSEQKISDLVENIINKQIETKQFINSDITLKEIDVVKKILKKKLMNIYHVRIAYPE
jgi:cyclic-di-AMP phosphodiesterase PgpH